MTDSKAEKLLSILFDSQMFRDGSCITFSIPAQAMKETIKGNSNLYRIASALMAEVESGVVNE